LGFVSLGAVTVTSGSVSDTWPQAGPGEVSNGNAPKAAAPKSRRFQTGSRDELRLITPHAPNITPQSFPSGILSYFCAYRLGKFWQTGWEHLAMCPRTHYNRPWCRHWPSRTCYGFYLELPSSLWQPRDAGCGMSGDSIRAMPVAVPALRSVSISSRSGCRQTMQVRGMRRSYIQRVPIFPSRVVLCFTPAPDRYSAHVEVSRRGGIASANATPARTYLKGAISTGNAMTLRN